MDFPIGLTTTQHGDTLFTIDRHRHTLIAGKSGVGKSTLLVNLAIWSISEGDGVLFVDPHGDAADQLLRQIPKPRLKDVIYINPLGRNAIGLNIFDYKAKEDRERAVQAFLTMVKNIDPDNWGPETERVLNAAANAVIAHFKRPTIKHVYLFIARKKFRDRLARKNRWPMLKDFIQQYDEELRASERMAKFSPPMNKIDKFIRPVVRTMLCQLTSIDFLAAMNERKLIIVKLSKGRLGAIASSIIGSVILSHISIAALRRTDDRSPFHVMVDEVHNFVAGIDLPTLLAEARKYGITATIATQNRQQLPSPEAVLGNCSNIIIYRMSGEDSITMATELGNPMLGEAIANLPDRECYALTIRDGHPSLGKRVRALAPFARQANVCDRQTVIDVSRRKYGLNRKELDKEIMKSLAA